MSTEWTTMVATDVRPGDRVKVGEREVEVSRVEAPFLGQDTLVCFIEDTARCWYAQPVGAAQEFPVLRNP